MRRGPFPLTSQIAMMASTLQLAGDLTDEARADKMRQVLLGISQYHKHPYRRPEMPAHVVWQEGQAKVYAPDVLRPGKPILLLVPSMVNRATIMDLMPERSLLRWLWGQGVNACLLDWGEPTQDEDQSDIESIIVRKLVPAIENLAGQHGGPIHVLGYCMGGTLVAAAAQIAAPHIASVTFLAAPWDFHVGAQHLLTRVQFFAPQAGPRIAEKGYLPMSWMQELFASLQPDSAAQKFADFAAMDQDADATNFFVAVEDWLNDGVDLPAATARQPIEEWFIENRPARGQWYVAGQVINPASITCPALIITSHKDRLVDYETAASLHRAIAGSSLIDSQCGHVGMMVGSKAQENVWQPLAAWIARHS